MKSAEAEKHGDVSPLSGSLSNLAESAPPEPTYERLPNFSRVTPTQMLHVTFPRDSRYQPVRPVSTYHGSHKSATSVLTTAERYAGGGCILILNDLRPSEQPDYYEFTTHTTAASQDAVEVPRNPHIALDENAPEVGPPEPFEVSLYRFAQGYCMLTGRDIVVSVRERCVVV